MKAYNDMDYKEKWDYLRKTLKVGLVVHYLSPYLKNAEACDLTVTSLTKKQIIYTVSYGGEVDKTLSFHPDTFVTNLVDGYQGHKY
jgi:muramidase (phage lysozyme)